MALKKCNVFQFKLGNFLLRHDVASDFYLSSFQRSQSTTPLLIIRALVFIACVSIWIASKVPAIWFMPVKFWTIYLTHWGLILNTIAAGFGLLVCVMASIKLPVDSNSRLPWYILIYWAMFNIATTIAFFITLFYWTLLTNLEQDFAINLTLDIFIHAINSVLMFVLLITSRQPVYFLHFYMPIGLAIIYLIFSYIYFVTGGTDAFGHHAIYPMIDWENPGLTVGIAALCTFGLIVIHAAVVGMSVARDIISRRFRKDTTEYSIHDKTFNP